MNPLFTFVHNKGKSQELHNNGRKIRQLIALTFDAALLRILVLSAVNGRIIYVIT